MSDCTRLQRAPAYMLHYREGRAAYYSDKPIQRADCPYPPDSDAAYSWLAGYDDAQGEDN